LRPALGALSVVLAVAGCGGPKPPADASDAATGAPAPTAVPSAPTASAPTPTGPTGPLATTATPTTATPTTATPTTTASTSPASTADPSAADAGGVSGDGTGLRGAEARPGGAGDEEPIRQPAAFTLSAADVRPVSIAVAPFLAVALSVVNEDAAAHTVKLVGTDVSFRVPPGGRVERRLPGLKAGTYTVAVDGGKAAASLRVGDDAGP
jgi:hypothetical protein